MALPRPTTADPSDADLLRSTASLMDAMDVLRPPLSRLVRLVCSVYCAGADAGTVRGDRLIEVLADYLHDRHVLPNRSANRCGLDAWAYRAPLVVVRAAVAACARHLAAAG